MNTITVNLFKNGEFVGTEEVGIQDNGNPEYPNDPDMNTNHWCAMGINADGEYCFEWLE